MFDEFWSHVPKGRKVAKFAAERAYKKALKRATHMELVAGMKRSAEFWEKEKTALNFIPHAATWLNDGRWLDEYEESNVVDLFKEVMKNG